MRRHLEFSRRLGVLGVACCVAWLMTPASDAVALIADADSNIEEHTPTDIEGHLDRMQTRSRPNAGSGRQHISYVRFDLSSFSPGDASGALFTMVSKNSTNFNTGQLQAYGLNDVAGNTPQNWVEATLDPNGVPIAGLSFNATGDEVPGDGDPETQDLGTIGTTGAENLWALGDLSGLNPNAPGQVTSLGSSELDNFLNSRAGNLATILVVNLDGTERSGLWMTRETAGGLFPPQLFMVPEPTSLALSLLGVVGIGLNRRRR